MSKPPELFAESGVPYPLNPMISREEVGVLRWLLGHGPTSYRASPRHWGPCRHLQDRGYVTEVGPWEFAITGRGIDRLADRSYHTGRPWHFLDVFDDDFVARLLGSAMGRALSGRPTTS